MEILIAAMSVLSLLTVAAYVMMMNMKKQVERGNKLRLIPAILIMGVCVIASGIPVRYSSASRLMLDLTAVAAPLLAMSFSVNLMHNPKPIFYLSVFMDSILITMHLMSFAGIIPPTPSGVFIIFVSAFIIGASAFFFLCILYHVRKCKSDNEKEECHRCNGNVRRFFIHHGYDGISCSLQLFLQFRSWEVCRSSAGPFNACQYLHLGLQVIQVWYFYLYGLTGNAHPRID